MHLMEKENGRNKKKTPNASNIVIKNFVDEQKRLLLKFHNIEDAFGSLELWLSN